MNTQNCGNVLVIGSAGVGKSTLIHQVLGSNVIESTEGSAGQLHLYESLSVPFRVFDAGDVGGSLLTRCSAVATLRRWSKKNALDGNEDNDINVIWYCIEGKSRKLIRQQLKHLSRATDIWYSVPIIIVLTKSYAESEREDNIALVRETCARRRRLDRCVRDIIPVVADTYQLTETSFVAPEGIPQLIEATNEVMPEGLRVVRQDIEAFALKRRRSVARGVIAASTAAGVAVAALPMPISDALILTPIETGLVNAISTLYGIKKDSASKQLLSTILEVGTVSTAAKTAISALKAVPGINLAASVVNAAIAGSIVAAIGEGSLRIFERIYKGEKTIDDTEWARSFMESKLSKEFISQGTKVLGQASGIGSVSSKDQRKALIKMLTEVFLSRDSRDEAKRLEVAG